MADKITGKTVLGAISDFLILSLLIGGAGFFGYYVGINQRLAPIQLVPPGTPFGKSLNEAGLGPEQKKSPTSEPKPANEPGAAAASSEKPKSENGGQEKTASVQSKKLKYWLSSGGADYCGCSITVKVNGTPVDAFFGPDKIIDVTKLVHHGDNSIAFEAKALGEQYNKHVGDAAYAVTVQLIKGPHIEENYEKENMIMTYSRTAADTADDNQVKHFTIED